MGLRSYILKRSVYSLILILIVICLNFTIFFAMPGDPYALFIPPKLLKPEVEEAIKRYWGYYDPAWLKLAKYVKNLLSWDFGKSTRNMQSVAEQMSTKIPWTLFLVGGSTVLAIVFGVLLGVMVAHRRGGLFDTTNVSASLIVGSLPTFWMGVIFMFVFARNLRWFPVGLAQPPEWVLGGYPYPLGVNSSAFPLVNIVFNPSNIPSFLAGYLRHAFLPVLTLTLFQYGGYLLLTRAVMIEAMTEDYILTARAKGLTEREVLFRHALKNASLPIITSVALTFGFILSGAIITETVYSWPGLGLWIWDAISTTNYPVLMASFYVIALCAIISVFIADLIYGIVDPRIHYG